MDKNSLGSLFNIVTTILSSLVTRTQPKKFLGGGLFLIHSDSFQFIHFRVLIWLEQQSRIL